MAFVDTKKRIEICKISGKNVELLYVTDIGPAEGLDGFMAFWRSGESMPFYIISEKCIESITIQEHIPRTGASNADS